MDYPYGLTLRLDNRLPHTGDVGSWRLCKDALSNYPLGRPNVVKQLKIGETHEQPSTRRKRSNS